MKNETLKQKIVSSIGNIAWILFCWSYKGGSEQYSFDKLIDEYRYRFPNGCPNCGKSISEYLKK